MGQIVIDTSSIAFGAAPLVGFGQVELAAPAAAASPWAVALVTSVVGAAAGWTIEELARNVRGKRRRR
jgi:hypothetical protein